MIARTAWIALLLAIAVATAGLQLDRQSRETPALAASVPEPFRASASRVIAEDALRSGNNDLALAEAERLVRKRPLPAEHLRLLAQAQLANGNLAGGSVAIQIAAQRGWRDQAAQEAMLRLALGAGDRPEAARRYLALLLPSRTDDEVMIALGAQIFTEANDEAEDAVVEVLTGSTRWHGAFLNRALRVLPPASLAKILLAASDRGVRFECPLMTRAVRVMARDASVDRSGLERLESQACTGPVS